VAPVRRFEIVDKRHFAGLVAAALCLEATGGGSASAYRWGGSVAATRAHFQTRHKRFAQRVKIAL
jgi:hypothetical protein